MGQEINITLPDGTKKGFPEAVTAQQVAESISRGLAKAAVVAKVDGKLVDLSYTIDKDAEVAIVTDKDPDGLETIRHSTAHLMAMAVQALFPDTQVTIGPTVDNGYYYDLHREKPFTPDDLKKIEKKMQEIRGQKLPLVRKEVTREEAIETFEKLGEKFKVEMIKEFPEGEVISVYHQGDWFDLCTGPHVPHTGKLKAFKLTSVAGAYWRADETKAKLQRIYGTAFASEKELKEYLERVEEAKKRDHRKLGRELELFMFREEAPAMPFFYPKGHAVYNSLVQLIRANNRKRGYKEVSTPLVMDEKLWRRSGHWDHYQENMYFTEIDERVNAVKPMNCPGHALLYGSGRHSYRDLPYRMSEFGRCHRYERSGVTHGLFRVRNFVQDDAHIFCTLDQLENEVIEIIDYVYDVYKVFGFEKIKVGLSTKPEKAIGEPEVWEKAEVSLEKALKTKNMDFDLYPGDGAFYGPKIDFHVEDSLGRLWQCGTCQADFMMGDRFELKYIGEDGASHVPIVVHRAIIGSVERFMGVLIEHYGGAFPYWMAPEQMRLVNIVSQQEDYVHEVLQFLKSNGIRAEADIRNEKLGAKIRKAQIEKVPYTLVIGDKEVDQKTVTLRPRQGDQVTDLSWDALLDYMQKNEPNPLKLT